jgi:hypothetical protein
MDGLNMIDPRYLLLIACTTAAFGAIGVAIYVNLCLMRYFYRKWKGKS